MSNDTNTQNGPVRLGIIGAGLAVKQLHWPAFQKLPGKFRIVSVCRTDMQAAQEVAELAAKELDSPGCRWTTDYKEILASDDIEAVLVSMPIQLTAQVILDAVKAGKHVIAEKPIAGNLTEARELVAALQNFSGPLVEIAENYRYSDDFVKAKEWLKAGRIGQPYLIQMYSRFFSDTTESFAATPWRWDGQYRGGIVTDAGVHYAAGLRELGGDVAQLQAFTQSVHPVLKGGDTLVLNMRFKSGLIGNLVFSAAARTSQPEPLWAAVFGTEGAIHISKGRVTLSEGYNDEAHVVEEFVPQDFDRGYKAEFENFYEAIRQGAPILSTAEEALHDLELIMSAMDSAESGQVISL